jgi:hypothetical protein
MSLTMISARLVTGTNDSEAIASIIDAEPVESHDQK